jgi:hypothetical protein
MYQCLQYPLSKSELLKYRSGYSLIRVYYAWSWHQARYKWENLSFQFQLCAKNLWLPTTQAANLHTCQVKSCSAKLLVLCDFTWRWVVEWQLWVNLFLMVQIFGRFTCMHSAPGRYSWILPTSVFILFLCNVACSTYRLCFSKCIVVLQMLLDT